MQQSHAKTAGPVSLTKARVEPAPIWVLVAGVVLLLVALGPSFVKPASTSPVRPAAVTASASGTRAAIR
jgi:hypothetical protein